MASVATAKPASRPSSRSSYRAPSPAGSVDSNGYSSRRREERSSTLEKLSRTGTPQQRTFSPITAPSSIPIPISFPTTPVVASTPTKARRSSSFDKLTAITAAGGTDSLIPLPVRVTPARRTSSPTLNGNGNSHGYSNGLNGSSGIPEGVPIEFGVASPLLGASRSLSPTRTLSRIPVSSVGHARTLADEGQRRRASSPTTPGADTSLLGDTSYRSSMSSLSPLPGSANTTMPTSPSPGYRRSLVGGGTTKVLADLQAHTIQVKSVLENTKSQLRSSQRTIAQLTRQTEDLKDGRERLRLENESLNNVVTRKERLLQELLDRARKAEGEAQLLKAQLKSETSTSKKSLRDMEGTLAEAKAVAQRSEREYVQLRDAMGHMRQGWRTEVESLREQMKQSRTEAQEGADRQKALLKLLEEQRIEREKMDKIRTEQQAVQEDFAKQFREQLTEALASVEQSSRDCDTAGRTAKDVADELARLQRLIKAGPGREQV